MSAIDNGSLTPEQRAERGDYVGCVVGALSFAEYPAGLANEAAPEPAEADPSAA